MDVFTGTKEKDQYDMRQHGVVLRDQFGRRWETTIDKESGGACAPINPKGWHDILNTPPKFKKLVRDEDGRLSLEIAVDDWIAVHEEAEKKYDRNLYSDALMLFGTEGVKAYEERSPGLINYTGPGPGPIEPLLALKDENAWILGRTTTPDPRLAPYFVKRQPVRPSFKDVPDAALDVEEAADPDALGGKVQKVGAPKARKPQKALVEA